jgi:hypothetical protein
VPPKEEKENRKEKSAGIFPLDCLAARAIIGQECDT